MRRGTAGMERPVTVWRGAAWHGKAGMARSVWDERGGARHGRARQAGRGEA